MAAIVSRITPRKVDQLGAVLVVLVGIALSVTFIGRGLTALRASNAESAALTGRLDYLSEVATMLGEGEQTLDLLRSRADLLSQRLPDRIDYPRFFADFSAAAQDKQIELIEVLPGEIESQTDYVKLPIYVTAAARYQDLHDFLHALSVMPRLVKLDRLEVSMSDMPPLCAIELNLEIYAVNTAEPNDETT